MRIIKIIWVLQVAGMLIGWQAASAQKMSSDKMSINGDTIFVHEGVEQAIAFIAEPSRVNLESKEYDVSHSRKLVTVMPRSKDTKPGVLTVQEGPREHKFIVMYSGSASILDVYDISNPQKLEEKYNDFGKRKLAATASTGNKDAATKNRDAAINDANNDYNNGRLEEAQKKFQKIFYTDLAVDESVREKLLDITNRLSAKERDKFYNYLSLAKNSAKAKEYEEAIEYSNEALKIRPNDSYAKSVQDEVIKNRDEDRYQGAVNSARQAMVAQNYEDAKKALDDAKKLRPTDPQLKEIGDDLAKLSDKLAQIKKDKELEDQYNQAIAAGDAAYKAADYDAAKTAYMKASTFKNTAYTKDQLKLIDKKVADIAAAQKAERERLEKEQRINASYQAMIDKANSSMEKKDYTAATQSYKEASDIKPSEQYPKNKLEEIKTTLTRIEEEKERQRINASYQAMIDRANSAMEKKDYTAATQAYKAASDIKPAEQLPKDKLQEIKDTLVRIEEEKERQRINASYQALVDKANSAMEKKDYTAATRAYKEASDLKSTEQYPKDKLQEIKNIQEQAEKEKALQAERVRIETENKKNYVIAINKGRSLQQKNALELAKAAYTEAAQIDPSATEPKQQLAKIDSLLIEFARRDAIDAKYNKLIHIADSALGAGDLNLSFENYRKAADVKPGQTYVANQMKSVENRMQEKAAQDKLTSDTRLVAMLGRSRKAKKDQNWPEALKYFKEILELYPGNEEATVEIRIIQNQIDKGPNKRSTQGSVSGTKQDEKKPAKEVSLQPTGVGTTPAVKNDIKSSTVFEPQKVAFPYNIDVLKSKYPAIDFTTPPREQQYDDADDYKEYYAVIKNIFNESPKLNIQNSSNNIKLVVQNMSIKGANTYIRLTVQNGSNADFLLGPMLLNWHKKRGSTSSLYPGSIYPATFPVVAPGKEYSLVYIFKDADVSNDESLSFELGDREKKTSLQVTIPGAMYNGEKKRL